MAVTKLIYTKSESEWPWIEGLCLTHEQKQSVYTTVEWPNADPKPGSHAYACVSIVMGFVLQLDQYAHIEYVC